MYISCVRSCLVYGSETLPTKLEHEIKLDRNTSKREERYRAWRIAQVGTS